MRFIDDKSLERLGFKKLLSRVELSLLMVKVN